MHTLKQRFIELFNASGWSQAEAARRMDMTRGGINGIVTGPTIPSVISVRFLEMLMMQAGLSVPGRAGGAVVGGKLAEDAGTCGTQPGPVAELAQKLSEIQARDPKNFQTAKSVIESLHHGLKAQSGGIVVSSGTKPVRKRLLSKAAASVRKPAGSAA